MNRLATMCGFIFTLFSKAKETMIAEEFGCSPVNAVKIDKEMEDVWEAALQYTPIDEESWDVVYDRWCTINNQSNGNYYTVNHHKQLII